MAKAIKVLETRKRKEAMAAVEAAAKEAGFSLSELVGSAKAPKKPPQPAKYRHPENSSVTWSGRGRQPAWYKEAIEAGTPAEDLLVKQESRP